MTSSRRPWCSRRPTVLPRKSPNCRPRSWRTAQAVPPAVGRPGSADPASRSRHLPLLVLEPKVGASRERAGRPARAAPAADRLDSPRRSSRRAAPRCLRQPAPAHLRETRCSPGVSCRRAAADDRACALRSKCSRAPNPRCWPPQAVLLALVHQPEAGVLSLRRGRCRPAARSFSSTGGLHAGCPSSCTLVRGTQCPPPNSQAPAAPPVRGCSERTKSGGVPAARLHAVHRVPCQIRSLKSTCVSAVQYGC